MRESKTVLDSEFDALDSGFRVLDSSLCKTGFWIPNLSGIPGSLSCIPDYKAKDTGFHKPKFLRFRNPDSLTWGEIFQWAGGGWGEVEIKEEALYWEGRGLGRIVRSWVKITQG